MSRPVKKRHICRQNLPNCTSFTPADAAEAKDVITLTIDEYETIRLLDGESLTQQECAARMGIARTSVQAIYESARKKIADVIINGKQLLIDGGNCLICNGSNHFCGQPDCPFLKKE